MAIDSGYTLHSEEMVPYPYKVTFSSWHLSCTSERTVHQSAYQTGNVCIVQKSAQISESYAHSGISFVIYQVPCSEAMLNSILGYSVIL